MQTFLRYVVAALVLLGIIAFMTTYTVRFTETAVVTTFGKAGEDSVKSEPGLRFKWPYPVQSVTRYDTRARFVESRPETQQTADSRQIILTAFMTYKVADPLKFYRLFSNAGSRSETHYNAADDVLRSKLRFAISETSKFKLQDLFAVDAGSADQSGLTKLEAKIFEQLKSQDGAAAKPGNLSLADYGIEPIAVGISSIKLPEETSKAVFARMGQTRERIAQEAVSKGNAQANQIRSDADSAAKKIMAFAEGRAKAIRGQGDQEAAQFLARQNADPELAVFLKNLDFMRDALSKKTTLILPTSMPGMNLFSPDALSKTPAGTVPKMNLTPSNMPGAEAKPAEAKPADPKATDAKPVDAPKGGSR